MKLIFVTFVSLILVGCLKTTKDTASEGFYQEPSLSVDSDLDSVKTVASSDSKNSSSIAMRLPASRKKVRELQRKNADALSEVETLKEELRQMNARLLLIEQKKEMTKEESLRKRIETLENILIKNETKKDQKLKETAKKNSSVSYFEKAEEAFVKEEWSNAIELFQKFRKKNPESMDIAMATYKIGVCFQELKMNREAQSFYNLVKKDFPKTKAASYADYRLSSLSTN